MSKEIRCANCGNKIEVDIFSVAKLDDADYNANCCEDPDYYFYEV